MSAKKKTTKPAVAPTPPSGVVALTPAYSEHGVKQLNQLDLARYELAQIKCVSSYQAISLLRATFEREVIGIEKALDERRKRFTVELADSTARTKSLEGELRDLQKQIETAYGIDFSRISYDDTSGELREEPTP